VILQVEEHGLLGVTQQLSKFGNDEFNVSSNQHNHIVENPFGSPTKVNHSPAYSTSGRILFNVRIHCVKFRKNMEGINGNYYRYIKVIIANSR
jgi:hypothetical protein